MSDLEGILEEEEGGGEPAHRISLRDVTSASKANTQIRKRHHKHKMHKKRLSRFERTFSQLAFDNELVIEQKRIDYILVHSKKTSAETEDEDDQESLLRKERDRLRFTKLLEREGFTVQTSVIGDFVYTKLHCPFKRLCREAERVKFEMPIKDCPKLDPVSETCVSRFLDKYFETDDEDDFISTGFSMNKIEKFLGHENPNNFFRPAVRSFLTHHILINLNINDVVLEDDLVKDEDHDVNSDKARPLEKKGDEDDQPPKWIVRKGLPYMLMKRNYVDSFVMHEESSRSSIRGDNFLTDTPRNEDAPLLSDSRKDLDDTWTKPFKFQPLWKIRNYFGERIAFYFAWSGMLCSTLWIPTLFGMCVFFYGMYKSATVREGTSTNGTSIVDSFKDLFGDFKQSFDNDITPYFGLIICVWGTVFLEIWKRKKAELAYEWDVEQFEANEPDRPSFTGTRSKKDPVTDEYVWYYPFKRQFIKFCFSFSVLIMMIAMVLISVVAIITYRVIMDIDYCPNIPAAECLMLTTVLSSVLNAVSILLLSRFYNVLARWLTEWENHRTQTRYDDALIFKLFAFQFVNSYASCFYIAFFRGRFDNVGFVNKAKYTDSCEGSCMTQLSFQVLILMLIKPFPKFFKDIILVWIKKMWRKYPNVCQCLRKLQCCSTTNQVGDGDIEAAVADGKNRARHTQHLQFLKHEHLKPELGDFTLDEYTEKIIQYGFLMLFATSFPLAPLLALLTNMFDLRVDAKRLLWWYRRPIAHVAQDIGMWYQILLFVNFAGVVSNAFLLAFTSTWGASYSTTGKLIIVIAFEHIVFALKYIVSYMIPDTPAHVQLSIRREQYQIQKKMEEPTKDMDYAHLFPVDLMLNEDSVDRYSAENGTEHDGGDLSQSRTPSARHPTSPSKKDSTKEAQKTYGLKNTSKQREGSTKTDMRSDDLDASYGGYVDLSEDERRKRLTPTSELWYCGHKSDSDSSNTQLLGQSRTAVAKQPSNTNLSSSRVSRVSASDVKPQGNKLWDSVDEVETQQSAGMRLHSPTYPSANEGTCNLFANPRNQHQSGNSTTEC